MVKQLAETTGIPQEALIQEWIIEKLHEYDHDLVRPNMNNSSGN